MNDYLRVPFLLLIGCGSLWQSGPSFCIPPEINHQGVVRVSGKPFEGTGEFRFAVVDSVSGENLWTNDGSHIGSTQAPDTAVLLPVKGGLYSVRLGDADLSQMTPIPASVFSGDHAVLRIWFDDGVHGISQLSPDHALTSAPYAFRSASALDGVPSGFSILGDSLEAPPGFTSTGLPIEAGDVWIGRAPMPTARVGLAVGVVNGRIYAIGGFDSNSELVGTNEEYDPATNTWRERAPMPTPRANFAIGVVNGKIYAMGGNVSPFTINEEYDPATDSWTTKAPMPSGRQDLGIGVINDKIYAVGGGFGGGVGDKNEEYDPATDTWTVKAPMEVNRLVPAVGVLRVRLLLVGPVKNDDKGSILARDVLSVMGGLDGTVFPTDAHEFYDPSTDSWTNAPALPAPRSNAQVGVINNRAYLLGGNSEGFQRVDSNEAYDASSRTWAARKPLRSIRSGFAVGTIGNKIYVIGGTAPSGERLRTNEEYTSSEVLYVHRKD